MFFLQQKKKQLSRHHVLCERLDTLGHANMCAVLYSLMCVVLWFIDWFEFSHCFCGHLYIVWKGSPLLWVTSGIFFVNYRRLIGTFNYTVRQVNQESTEKYLLCPVYKIVFHFRGNPFANSKKGVWFLQTNLWSFRLGGRPVFIVDLLVRTIWSPLFPR